MIKAYFVRGTTLHGKPVDAGATVDLDDDTFRILSSYKDVIPAKDAPAPLKEKPETKKENKL